ncbi:unnamed protein product [Ectocarpus sp. 4 AP-2014]
MFWKWRALWFGLSGRGSLRMGLKERRSFHALPLHDARKKKAVAGIRTYTQAGEEESCGDWLACLLWPLVLRTSAGADRVRAGLSTLSLVGEGEPRSQSLLTFTRDRGWGRLVMRAAGSCDVGAMGVPKCGISHPRPACSWLGRRTLLRLRRCC